MMDAQRRPLPVPRLYIYTYITIEGRKTRVKPRTLRRGREDENLIAASARTNSHIVRTSCIFQDMRNDSYNQFTHSPRHETGGRRYIHEKVLRRAPTALPAAAFLRTYCACCSRAASAAGNPLNDSGSFA